MFQEYDVVKANKPIEGIPEGTKGVILIVFEDGLHYEAEFVDNEGNTIKVITVSENDIEKWQE